MLKRQKTSSVRYLLSSRTEDTKSVVQSGFTLVELMISITLGLLVTAAALQMTYSSQRVLSAQQAGSNIQDEVNFGIHSMARNIRAGNFEALGAADEPNTIMRPDSALGGIVITTDDNPIGTSDTLPEDSRDKTIQNLESIVQGGAVIENGFLSCSGDLPTNPLWCGAAAGSTSTAWTGKTNLVGADIKSDQLVIMYRAPMDTFDCEGNQLARGDYAIERYFLRTDSIVQPNEPTPLALACDAGQFSFDETSYIDNTIELRNYGDSGEILLTRVDHFAFKFGVMENTSTTNLAEDPANNQIAYYTLKEYLDIYQKYLDELKKDPLATVSPPPRITHVKFAVLVRSMLPAKVGTVDANQTFDMLGHTGLKVSSESSIPYMRKVFTTTVVIRSARG